MAAWLQRQRRAARHGFLPVEQRRSPEGFVIPSERSESRDLGFVFWILSTGTTYETSHLWSDGRNRPTAGRAGARARSLRDCVRPQSSEGGRQARTPEGCEGQRSGLRF